MFGNNAPDGAEILALLGMRPTTKHAPTLARPKIKFAKPRFVPTGSISAPDPSIRNSIQQTLAGVLSKAIDERQAHRLASRAMAPLTDATPLGNVTGAEEGGKQFYRGLTRGDARTAGLGALSFGLSVLPVPGGVKKAARKTGLFGSLMKDQSGAIRAWHGSPHDFDRFDMSKIGTGEGAQAYGHGLYFAENKDVAQQYQNILSNRSKATDDPASAAGFWLGMNNGDREATIKTFESMKAQNQRILDRVAQRQPVAPGAAGHALSEIQAADEALAHLAAGTEAKSGGRLYEVNINAEPEDFLDWDAPLSGQQHHLRNLRQLEDVEAVREQIQPFELGSSTGNSIYWGLQRELGSKQAATERLRSIGLPGLRFLDQGSRDAAKGTRNIVTFDDSLIDILGKY